MIQSGLDETCPLLTLQNVQNVHHARRSSLLIIGSKNPSRATSNAKSAPAKYGGRGGHPHLKNIDPRRAAKMEKSYNMLRRPTDRALVRYFS